MVVDQRVFIHTAENVTARDMVADLELCGIKVPAEFTVEGLGVDTACNVSCTRI